MIRYLIPVLLIHSVRCDCSSYGPVSNGNISPDKASYAEDDIVTVTCDSGYRINDMSVDTNTTTATCTAGGTWDVTDASCVVCRDDTDCTNGTCNFSNLCQCGSGFTKKPDTKTNTVCTEIFCNLDIDNSTLTPPGDEDNHYSNGAEVEVQCDDDYHIYIEGQDSDPAITSKNVTCNGGNWDFVPVCVVCDDGRDDQCTNAECRSNRCYCIDGHKKKPGSKKICELVQCKADTCNGEPNKCEVIDDETKCTCIDGLKGDHCKQYVNFPCEAEPCGDNGESCRRADFPKVNEYVCTCKAGFSGSECQYADGYHLSSTGQLDIALQEPTTQIKLDLVMPVLGNIDAMLVAIVQVDESKLLLTHSGGCLGVTLVNTTADTTSEFSLCPKTDSLDFSLDQDEDGNLTVSWGAEIYTGHPFSSFKRILIGGCGWEDGESEGCIATSRVYYREFAGTIRSVHLMNDEKMTAAQLTGQGATIGNMSCSSADPCGTAATCSDEAPGSIKCTCTDAATTSGFDCLRNVASFNGYTSYKVLKLDVQHAPISPYRQILQFTINADNLEAGDVMHVELPGSSCPGVDFSIVLEKGLKYKVSGMVPESFVSGEVIEIGFDDTHIYYGTHYASVKLPECSQQWNKEGPGYFQFDLGTYRGITQSDLKSVMFGGCIENVLLNSYPVLGGEHTEVVAGVNVNDTQCSTSLKPTDPCAEAPCLMDSPCETEETDYSYKCDCSSLSYPVDDMCGFVKPCGSSEEICTEDNTEECIDNSTMPDPWHTCKCKTGWEGIKCETSSEVPDPEPVADKSNKTTIFIVVTLLAAALIIAGVVIVKRRKKSRKAAVETASNGATFDDPHKIEAGGIELLTQPDNIYDNDPIIISNPVVADSEKTEADVGLAAPEATPDAAPDATPDAAPDAAPDAVPEVAPEIAPAPDTTPDAAPEYATPDAAPEYAVPNAAPVYATPDAMPEAAPDAALNAAPEAAPEYATPDARPEAVHEAAPDAVAEYATPDAVPNAAPVYATPDAAPEAAPDAAPEAAPDAAPETAPEVAPEYEVLDAASEIAPAVDETPPDVNLPAPPPLDDE